MTTQRWETGQRDVFRASFDEDPDAYDRTRPVAPDHVFDDVVRLAGLEPGSTVVEIGPGTGQATRPLAERGVRVLALEIGPHLAGRARRILSGFRDVAVMTTSFEAWDAGEAKFDAVFACNAFHWVDPAPLGGGRGAGTEGTSHRARDAVGDPRGREPVLVGRPG